MKYRLHVLNGDATLQGFSQTGIEGDIMVWRDVLSEGPLDADISSAGFWQKRNNWISTAFNTDDYSVKVIDELGKLNQPYTEFNLWFEFDLHCQVNMLGVINLLSKKTDMNQPAVYLICPDSIPTRNDFRGMGELSGNDLKYLFDNIRVQLSDFDFTLAADAWQAYTKGNYDALKRFIDKTTFWGTLHSLKSALKAQLGRLQVNNNGLNYIEQKLTDIYTAGASSRQEIYKTFWMDEKIYGMGDTELDMYLNKLGILPTKL